ncbi:hypothetical protein [Actinoplanes sp. G11-F43]|uniref:hypothetical protein n=1 Tax=Actinoplanes sp. G11-F43 TaxID=3424130 RepID=UPI003D3385CA
MTPRPRQHRRTGARLLVLLAVALIAWLPTVPAAADPGDKCYVGSGKPYDPPLIDILPPDSPVMDCEKLNAYTQPSTLFGDANNIVQDREGNLLDAYYFDAAYGTVDGLTNSDVRLGTMIADWVLSLDKMIVRAACWLLNASITFGVADALLGPAAHVADEYQTQVVDRFGIVHMALMICVFWFGFAALRGRVGKGAGEILISFALAGISGVVLAAPADTVLGDEGLLGTTRDIGITLAALPLDDTDPATNTGRLTPNNVIDPFEEAIVDVFVRQPHQQLAYGVVFDDTGDGAHPCLDTYNKILKTGREESPMYLPMKDCDPRLAEHLRQDTGSRIIGTLLVTIGALILLIYVVVGVVIPVLGGQVALAFLAALLVIALPVSLTGGPGRRALWVWVGATTTVVAVIIVGFGSLSFFLVTTGAMIKVEGGGFLLRLLMVDVIALILLAVHRRISHNARTHVRHTTRRLDRARIGGSGMGGVGGQAWSMRAVWHDVQATVRHPITAGRTFAQGVRQGAGRGGCPSCTGTGTLQVYVDAIGDFQDIECPTCGGTGMA